MTRKAGIHDTAFTHQIHNVVDEVPSEDSDNEIPETKYQYFEFSNGYFVMRVIRMIFVIQVIGMMIEHPSIGMAVMFETFCRGIAMYSLQFHFRPFLDIIYVIQLFLEKIKEFLLSQKIPLNPTSVEIVMRRLNVNPYLDEEEKPTTPPPAWSVDALNDRNFHTMKFYSQFILTVFFVVMALLLTVRFWEIHDYSNREEVKTWLQTYIADGWWRRGGLNIIINLTRALIALLLIIFVLYAIPNNLGGGSIPNALYLSTIFFVGIVILTVICLIGYYFIRITESSFTRYVSQNVAYTSAIILKRVVKAKIDLGIILLTALYMPLLYYSLQAMLFFTDWNRTLVTPLRKNVNYFTPCYYMGFKPYRRDNIDRDTCAMNQYSSSMQGPDDAGNFYSRNILSCDSYWGIIVFVVAASVFTMGIVGYFYIFYSFISQTMSEFVNSRWVDILDKLLKIRDEERQDYQKRFPFWDRLYLNASILISYQLKSVRISLGWFFSTLYFSFRFIMRLFIGPIIMLLGPILFLLERLFVISCLNFTFSSKEERARQRKQKRRGSLQLGSRGGRRRSRSAGSDTSRSVTSKAGLIQRTSSIASIGRHNSQRGISRGGSSRTMASEAESHASESAWNTSDNNIIAYADDYTTYTGTSDMDEFVSPLSVTKWLGPNWEQRYSPSFWARKYWKRVSQDLHKRFISLSVVVYIRFQMNLLWHYIFADEKQKKKNGYSLTEVGGAFASWRRELTLPAKTRRLYHMRQHVINELRLSKEYFIADHELIISFCDYTLDSSALMTLLVPFKYEYLWWYIIVLIEMTAYPVFAATLRDYDVSWQTRNYLFLMINILFGLITFIVQPFTEELDRWLEFSGRLVIGMIAVGLPWYYSLAKNVIRSHETLLYEPGKAMSYIPQMLLNLIVDSKVGTGSQFALWIDLFMVLAFFMYLLSIVESIGIFRTLDRMFKAIVYTYHDHILDFLVTKSDERTFGYENVFSGMLFIQQWDEIIKLQRRYALLTWPDVRPATLVSWVTKLLEIKWAALFNLTIENLRSSLGLTLLHVVMSSADSEVARWLIHSNPSLLMVQDSQNDNPITIALKECAYFLLVYGEQEEGALDDGTSYSDEAYAIYYPEIDDIRDEIYAHGEFIPELCVTLYLSSSDIVRLKNEGVYYEPDDPQHPDYLLTNPPYLQESQRLDKEYDPLTRILIKDQERLAFLSVLASKPKAPEDVFRQLDDVKRAIKLTKKKQKVRQERQQQERNALSMKRFPEDDVTDDFESGSIHAWTIMDFQIPEDYIYLDPKITQMMNRDPTYHYHNSAEEEAQMLRLQQQKVLNILNGGNGVGNNQNIDEHTAYPSSRDVEASMNRPGTSSGVLSGVFSGLSGIGSLSALSKHKKPDLQYVIPSLKKVHYVDAMQVVPFSHPSLKTFSDWDRPRRNAGNHGGNANRRSSVSSDRQSKRSLQTATSSKFMALMQDRNQMLGIRWKVCRFAEILMSAEIANACGGMKWSVTDFKLFNKIASVNQGKIAQQLAMVSHLNPPPGFVRISDWSVPAEKDLFDEKPEEELPMMVKGIITVVSTIEKVAETTQDVFEKVVETVADVPGGIASTLSPTKMIKAAGKTLGMTGNPGDRRGSFLGDSSTNFSLRFRGRARRRRKTSHAVSYASQESTKGEHNENDDDNFHGEGMLSDRVVHFLAEALVCSSFDLNLDDMEMSHNARRGWRAICRALRQRHASFVVPSLFSPPKKIVLHTLTLTRNELDCGDCVLLCDVLTRQRMLSHLDISFNRIGARGLSRLCKALKDHDSIKTWYAHHNQIGPGVGKDLGLFLKLNSSILVLDVSYNHLGEVIRYPTMLTREKLSSAAHDIVVGLRLNKSLVSLDLSFNHLGPTLADSLAIAVNRHPFLHTLNISGNDLGSEAGPRLCFQLAGVPRGVAHAQEREDFIAALKEKQKQKHKEDEDFKKQSRHEKRSLLAIDAPASSDAVVSREQDVMKLVQNEISLWENSHVESDSHHKGDFDIFAGGSFFTVEDEMEEKEGAGGYLLAPLKSPSSPSKLASSSIVPQQKAQDDKVKKAMHAFSQGLDRAEKEQENIQNAGDGLNFAAMNLTSLSMADNQLGSLAGHAIAAILEKMKNITYLDMSGNALGPVGGERLTDQMEQLQDIFPREFIKKVLWQIEESKYTGRDAKVRKKVFTNLTALNLSRNALGPKVMESLALCFGKANSTLTSLNVSDNPLGSSGLHVAGLAAPAATTIRQGLLTNKSLIDVQMARSAWETTNLVTMLGGLAYTQCTLLRLNFNEMHLDEPSCLQLGQVITRCVALQYVSLHNCKMGSNGGLIICQKIRTLVCRQLRFLDLSGNYVGPVSAMYISEAIKDDDCKHLNTIYLADNDFLEEGGSAVARAMTHNTSITDLDLSNNQLTERVAHFIAEFTRGLFVNGVKVRETMLQRLLVNDNPQIGIYGSKILIKAASNERIQHLEVRNIGAGPRTAQLISSGLRDPMIAWEYVDVSKNHLTRFGLNQLFWAVRNNKRLRVLKVAENDAGPNWCTNKDALLRHGIAVPVAIRRNVVLRELDLSFNSLTSEAGVNIIDALIDNRTIKKVNLRGNLLDDEIASLLPDLFRCNNVLEELDMGQNRMAFACAFAIAESLEWNRSLRVLALDYNRFGGAGAATLDSFARSIMMNFSLQVLHLDGNKLGPEWGIQLAEVFARNNTLVQVSLRDNRLDLASGRALLAAYTNAKYLLELALTADEIGSVLWEEFRKVFESKRANVDVRMVLREETQLSESQSHLLQSYQVNAAQR
jgi:Ran GTPase-activating protein (RanGAP) involved in mRNA processing and transport